MFAQKNEEKDNSNLKKRNKKNPDNFLCTVMNHEIGHKEEGEKNSPKI